MQYKLFTQAAMMGACKSLQAQIAISAAIHTQRSIACLLREKEQGCLLADSGVHEGGQMSGDSRVGRMTARFGL